jgi:hypothetical protein
MRRKPAPASSTPLRDRFVSALLLWHVIDTIRAIHSGDPETTWEGDATAGRFASRNGEGDHHLVLWGEAGLVAMAFDHDAPNSEAHLPRERRDPGRLFRSAPAALAPLVHSLIEAREADRLGTASRWFAKESDGETEGSEEESDQLAAYESSPRQVLSSWRRVAGLSKAQADVALRLADPSSARRVVDAASGGVLLDPPGPGEQAPVDPRRVTAAVVALAAAQIEWPDGVEAATQRASADPDGGNALLRACAAEDVEAVRALLASGANLERRAFAGLLEGRHAAGGSTALHVAVAHGNLELARMLLDAGANPNALGENSIRPLGLAANVGRRDLCDLLLSRGANPSHGKFFFDALRGGNADVVELALDLGGDTSMSLHWFEMLKAIVDESGRTELLDRCPGIADLRARAAAADAAALAEARLAPVHCALSMGMLHLVIATRAIHFDAGARSSFDGDLLRGRCAVWRGDGSHALVAWSDAGVIGWASGLRRRNPTPAQPPATVFQHAPPDLRALALDQSAWEHAPKDAEAARWTNARAQTPRDVDHVFGPGRAPELWLLGTLSNTPNGTRFTLAHEASELLPRTVSALRLVLARALEDRSPSLTPEDESTLLEPQPGGRTTVSPSGISEAVRAFAQLGVAWTPRVAPRTA